MENNIFRDVSTELDLNGPTLSFSSHPSDTTKNVGESVVLSGIATVSFGISGPENFGTLKYQWYKNGQALSDTTNISGSATNELTLSNLTSPGDSGVEYYLTADYEPARPNQKTGNATNEPLASNTATLTINPQLEIVAQPSDRTVGINQQTTFTVDADLTDGPASGINYQWNVNGNDVTDGVIETSTVVYDTDTSTATYDRFYSSDSTVTLGTNARSITITLAGAQGGNGGSDAGGPGGGGYQGRAGRFTYTNGSRTFDIKIGKKGGDGGSGNQNAYGNGGSSSYATGGRGGGAGPGGWSGGGGGGGGASAIYDRSAGKFTIVSAGGGGGGGGSWNRGAEGPPNGIGAGLGYGRARDAIQGGYASPDPGDTGTTPGGDGGGGGGGGAGVSPNNFPGAGGGGAGGSDNNDGGNGGNGGASGYDPNYSTFGFDGFGNDGDGYANIRWTEDTTTTTTVTTVKRTTISGSNTNTLTISSDNVGVQDIKVKVSHATANNSPLTSNTAIFAVQDTSTQANVVIENIRNDSSTATIQNIDLNNSDYTFSKSDVGSNSGAFTRAISFYAPDRDLIVQMDLYGGKGADGVRAGGEGGYSRIQFTLEQNVEYVLAGLTNAVNTPFLYRKGSLIACVGQGGKGNQSRGGLGGGCVTAGGNAGGGTAGGPLLTSLGGDGVWAANIIGLTDTQLNIDANIYPEDAVQDNAVHGRTIKCTKGEYYRQQGFSSCEDVGTVKYRLPDGTEVTNTAAIARGYKDGYGIIETGDQRITVTNAGTGGNGATGGLAADGTTDGGGGGSGYADQGVVSVIDTQQGGSTEDSKVILRVIS